MHAFIFLNSEMPPQDVLTELLKDREEKLIIGADGGFLKAVEAGLKPDVAIGDFDSLRDVADDLLIGVELVPRPSQYMNDLEKALLFCRERHIRSITVIGVTGKRLDHTLANISILWRYQDVFHLEMIGNDARLYFLDEQHPECIIPARVGQAISLIPLSRATGINTSGLKYPLKNGSLYFGIREGSSNEAVSENVTISIRSGKLLVICNF